MLFHQMSLPFASLDFIGLDVTEPAIRFLNQQFGERFYVSEILAQKVKNNELGKKSGRGFLDHSEAFAPKSLGEKHYGKFESSLCRIYINDLQINHTNLVVRLLAKNKTVCFRSQDIPYFSRLERLDKKLFAKVVNACCFDQAEQIKSSYDLIIDSPPLESVGSLVQRIKDIQRRCLSPTPIAINIPIYRIEEIAAQTDHPTLVFGINCQKSYLGNTEVVRRAEANPIAYEQLRLLIGELAGDCIKVNDDYARPLTFQIVSKMFEAMRVLEERIATVEEIEQLLINDPIFRDMDYFGLDNLLKVAEYCQPIYGDPFEPPGLLCQMIEQGQVGVAAGQGFYLYA
jgi:3-hydroxyacyl-CoA dehydrogenase